MVDSSFLFINFRSICSLIYARTFWDTLYNHPSPREQVPTVQLSTVILQSTTGRNRPQAVFQCSATSLGLAMKSEEIGRLKKTGH